MTSPAEALAALREAASEDPVPDAAARRDALGALRRTLLARAEDIARAADADYGGRSRFETILADVVCVADAAAHSARKLRGWMKPRGAFVPLPFMPARARVMPRPKGVVGILAPWNYPVQLALWPAVDALAAGNRVAIKPSEHTPRCAALIVEIVDAALGQKLARVVTGDARVAAEFAAQPWDHLVFTGGAGIARHVARAAAETLTPLTLELGGKCPGFVLPGADLARTARALLVGKALNAGQTCVAPDTALLVGHRFEALLAACRAAAPRVPETRLAPHNAARFERLLQGAEAHALADDPRAIRLLRAPDDAPAAREEIFGPAMLVVECATLDDAIAWSAARGVPLAAYGFGAAAAEARLLAERLRCGSLAFGRCVDHVAFPALPFGGAGGSGYGRYHGRAGFEAMSEAVPIVHHGGFALARLFDPPRQPIAERILARLLG
jgi:coniferyl-aldehyde dehydrogenase